MKSTRKKIELKMDVIDVLVTMAEGNPGAINAIRQLMDGNENGILDVLRLDDMNIRGSQIWVGFKDVCEGNVELFRKKIRDRDMEMVHLINKEMFADPSWTEMAVLSKRHG